MKLLLATSNPHKIEELSSILESAGLDIEVLPPSSVGGMPEVIEDADTFAGNALKKARALAEKIPEGSMALSDDSGICVDALNGAPGVYSARYAGEDATDEANLQKLIDDMATVPDGDRAGHFACCIAVVTSDGEESVFEGAVHGVILRDRRGENGFGYDPVFLPNGFDRTTAEMSEEEKAAISHRGNAIRKFVDWLKSR